MICAGNHDLEFYRNTTIQIKNIGKKDDQKIVTKENEVMRTKRLSKFFSGEGKQNFFFLKKKIKNKNKKIKNKIKGEMVEVMGIKIFGFSWDSFCTKKREQNIFDIS